MAQCIEDCGKGQISNMEKGGKHDLNEGKVLKITDFKKMGWHSMFENLFLFHIQEQRTSAEMTKVVTSVCVVIVVVATVMEIVETVIAGDATVNLIDKILSKTGLSCHL